LVIVIDASLAVKWYVTEANSEPARELFGAHAGTITVPEVFRTEVVGAMVRRANINKAERPASERSITAFLQLFDDGFINRIDIDERQMARAATLAIDLGHPLKDCIYLALAINLGCPLVTCDTKFAAKARGVYAGVRTLDE
jgi:predicted nucleic acid-binding protein